MCKFCLFLVKILSRNVAPAPLSDAPMKFSSNQGTPKEWRIREWLTASSKNVRKIFTVIEKNSVNKVRFEGFSLAISRKTYERVLNTATEEVIKTFRQRAERATSLFGKKYVLDELAIGAPVAPASQAYYANIPKKSYVVLTGCENNSCAVDVPGTVHLE
ncbi:MAG: hypothetical protein LBS40_00095 [Burkholderiales bacterium]|jgi:predicted secreted protein|nr:hypothetical protein [Burkholderiales bacterium]